MHTQKRFFCFRKTGRTLVPADVVVLHCLCSADCFLWEAYKVIFIYLYCDLVMWNQISRWWILLWPHWTSAEKQRLHWACAKFLTQTSSSPPFPCVERETSRVSISSAKSQSHSAHSWELCIKGSFSIPTNCHMYDCSNHLPEGLNSGAGC